MEVHYKRLMEGFKAWLETLGYSPGTVYGLPNQLKEFLTWLESQGITDIRDLDQSHVDAFLEYFEKRPNRRRPGGLSINHINKQIDTLEKFLKYLRLTGYAHLNITLHYRQADQEPERTVLSKEAIRPLYEVTEDSPVGMRDRAMLAVYYGCGLRKKEGLSLEVPDVLFERRLLYVRQAKNGQECYVPINPRSLEDLEQYIYTARPLLMTEQTPTETLFISQRSRPISAETLVYRLNVLKAKSGHPELTGQSFGLHTLRHSIATHLLEAGLSLEHIARFLGHQTLDSTQVYTHILNEQL
jgi:integrase/recombinase XerD